MDLCETEVLMKSGLKMTKIKRLSFLGAPSDDASKSLQSTAEMNNCPTGRNPFI